MSHSAQIQKMGRTDVNLVGYFSFLCIHGYIDLLSYTTSKYMLLPHANEVVGRKRFHKRGGGCMAGESCMAEGWGMHGWGSGVCVTGEGTCVAGEGRGMHG